MADLQTSIANFSQRNDELLETLRRTDYSDASLKQQVVYVKDIEHELAQLSSSIFRLETKTQIEKAEFERYRDSNIKRFAYKLRGSKGDEKFQSRTEKEEREYYEALEQERAAKDRKQNLELALKEGWTNRDTYQRDNDTRARAQKELDDLYNMIFAGPTPCFPDEDQMEWAFTQAREHFNGIEQQYRACWQAADIFSEAGKHISLAVKYMDEAHGASSMDMMGGGTWADMAERSALSRAESEASQCKSLCLQAGRVYPEGVQPLPEFSVAAGHMMSDMMFDNIFSDMAFHDKIKTSQWQIFEVQKNVKAQFDRLKHKLDTEKPALDDAQDRLTVARMALQDRRSQIFSQGGGRQPPPYQR